MRSGELLHLSATAAVQAMREGDFSAERYAEALLAQAARVERLNAFRTLQPEAVLESARACDLARRSGRAPGPLHGLPIPVKDSVNTSSLPTSNGTRALQGFTPKDDAAVVQALLAAGAIVMGKTNLHELSRGYTCNNGAFGPVRNPYHPDHVPGGSSGGSAVAVSARAAPLALAEDTLGSIRVPASLCGIAGLRPTFGRYPNAAVMPLTLAKFDQVGPLARSVADLALFDSVVSGEREPLVARDARTLRIALAAELLADLDVEVQRIATSTIDRLREAGVQLIEAPLPEIAADALHIAAAVIAYENRASIAAYLAEHQTGVTFEQLLAQASPNIQALYTAAPDRERYDRALAQRASLLTAMSEYFHANGVDALMFPPTLTAAPSLGDNLETEVRGRPVSIRTVMGRNTALGSAAALASVVLPAGLTRAGLPIGMEFAARRGSDRALLSTALCLEQLLDPLPAPPVL